MTVVPAHAILPERELRPLRWQLYMGVAAFGAGCLAGLAQALDRVLPAGSTLWRYFPLQRNYYQGLTMHGVLMALVVTFAFSNAMLPLVVARSLGVRLNRRLVELSAILMFVGTLLAGSQIIANKASVLFTMYPPLKASPPFYLGAALLVVSTWIAALAVVVAYREWRAGHPADRVPLQAYTVVATYAMWFIASLGIAVEVLGLLLPWSLGIVEYTDPQLARTLFWFSGHPIVYFWLLPAYISWYTMVPKQVGGRLYSDGLTRLVFALFLILSIPTGFHHQFTDPGISAALKKVHLLMTFAVFYPSLITAFSVMASLESGGRARGGRGLFGWIRALPWSDPSVTAQLLAMMAFVLGGISGLINASYNVNLVVHNSAWIPGHFHLTVGTAVMLSLIGISYWLVPYMTGRKLWSRRLALVQAWLWFGGVLVFSRGQIAGGLAGLPRRLQIAITLYDRPEWAISHLMTAVGGTAMFISGMLFVGIILMTVLRGEEDPTAEMPVGEATVGAEASWPVLDRWGVLVGITVVLILIAYGPYFLHYTPNFVSPGWDMWGGGG